MTRIVLDLDASETLFRIIFQISFVDHTWRICSKNE